MLPEPSAQEWSDCEREAGHPLMSKRAVYEFIHRKLADEAMARMLGGKK